GTDLTLRCRPPGGPQRPAAARPVPAAGAGGLRDGAVGGRTRPAEGDPRAAHRGGEGVDPAHRAAALPPADLPAAAGDPRPGRRLRGRGRLRRRPHPVGQLPDARHDDAVQQAAALGLPALPADPRGRAGQLPGDGRLRRHLRRLPGGRARAERRHGPAAQPGGRRRAGRAVGAQPGGAGAGRPGGAPARPLLRHPRRRAGRAAPGRLGVHRRRPPGGRHPRVHGAGAGRGRRRGGAGLRRHQLVRRHAQRLARGGRGQPVRADRRPAVGRPGRAEPVGHRAPGPHDLLLL
ncbi:MAG: hypothetical protein AVDCRST_MAG41-1670, partial [uncultured Corynebacteriales bacterium]